MLFFFFFHILISFSKCDKIRNMETEIQKRPLKKAGLVFSLSAVLYRPCRGQHRHTCERADDQNRGKSWRRDPHSTLYAWATVINKIFRTLRVTTTFNQRLQTLQAALHRRSTLSFCVINKSITIILIMIQGFKVLKTELCCI